MRKIGIYILNYNGRDLLKECLPSIIKASEKSIYKPAITVVDNRSVDDSKGLVRELFPKVLFLEMKENRVLSSFNEAVAASDADVVLLLNNDIRVDENCIDPLMDIFDKYDSAFMAAPKFYNYSGDELDCIWFIPKFTRGVFSAASAHLSGMKDSPDVCYTFQCGMAAFDKKKFLELGGFDDLYLPGRIEDCDLCFRAWKRGLRSYYQPRSVMFHKATVSFKKAFKEKELLALSHRNIYIFTWKNITDPKFLLIHFTFLIPRLLYGIVSFKTEIAVGFFRALRLMPRILKKRGAEKKFFTISDGKIFGLFNGESVNTGK